MSLWISIHAPRGGSDCQAEAEERKRPEFQSTLPVGGATNVMMYTFELVGISIHAPRGGSDETGERADPV